jgi:curved DNA-binding protein CbpA
MPADNDSKRPTTGSGYSSVERRRASGARPAARIDAAAPVDLTPEQQARVDERHRDIRALDMYAFLGVARDADKRTIKGAYYVGANEFHPDRFFRKRLGAFEPKMIAIFTRLTEAHDTLCSRERRENYDRGLRHKRFSVIEEMLEQAADEMRGAEEASRREEAAVEYAVWDHDAPALGDRASAITLRPPPVSIDSFEEEPTSGDVFSRSGSHRKASSDT